MKLASVPQILDILVSKEVINVDQKSQILAELDKPVAGGVNYLQVKLV